MGADTPLDRGRSAFAREAWVEAWRELADADAASPLGPEDLERLSTAAYLVGKDAAAAEARTRAHAAFLERGDPVPAARSAFFLAFPLIDRPAHRAQAGGWIARARRLLEACGQDCAEQALVFCAVGFEQATSGNPHAGLDAYQKAEAIAARFRDGDVLALARHGVARCLIRLNRAGEGFALMDEVMVAVTSGEVTPIISGVVYCSLISACHDAFDFARAREWTAALASWCDAHPDMVPFRTQCLIRRSELLQLQGDWPLAAVESDRAADLSGRTESALDIGPASYQRGELHRLRGEFAQADECYRRASQAGRKPYPGLALLRLAQDQPDAAEAVVRSMLAEVRDPRARSRALGACVEILVARQDLAGARAACEELVASAREIDAPVLHAQAAHAEGRVALATGDAARALPLFGEALAVWQELAAPYEMARVRVSIGLGALAAPATEAANGPLTGREVEVLRLVASGKTNRLIAAELAISEKTVARHMSNIFTKLDLPSRAAATAYAYEHKLV